MDQNLFYGDRLQTGGLCGIVRHPQYTGIFLVIFGQLVHWPTILTLVLAPVIVLTYVRLARREEARLIKQFGEAYRKYMQRVPMFLPRWRDMRRARARTISCCATGKRPGRIVALSIS